MTPSPRLLLLQIRNESDPMRHHEVECFARVLSVPEVRIRVFDLLSEVLELKHLREVDVVLLGGSGDYSVTEEAAWLDQTLASLRHLHASSTPTFASCWGFQAMARAMGGRVVHDPERAEVGSCELSLTAEGMQDPIFEPLGERFIAQVGHEDHVVELPANTTLLAVSPLAMHAYRFEDAPIYCTQFHPELAAQDLVARMRAYPRYVEMVTGQSFDAFVEGLVENPDTEDILPRFLERTLGAPS